MQQGAVKYYLRLPAVQCIDSKCTHGKVPHVYAQYRTYKHTATQANVEKKRSLVDGEGSRSQESTASAKGELEHLSV